MEYDEIIVGAGSAGAVLAARLSEDPDHTVLLLEAGPDYASIEEMPDDLLKPWVSWADHDWGFEAEAAPGRTIKLHRGKVVGGSSAVNGTIALRGVPGDFQAWVDQGNDEWSWEKVLPAYRRLESDPEGGDFQRHQWPDPDRAGRSRRSGSQSSGRSTRRVSHWGMRTSSITTCRMRRAWGRGRATANTGTGFRPTWAIWCPTGAA